MVPEAESLALGARGYPPSFIALRSTDHHSWARYLAGFRAPAR